MPEPTTYGKIYDLSLPSGNKVKVRRPSLLTLIRTGQLPSTLVAAVWKVFGQAEGPASMMQSGDDVQMMIGMMDATIKSILVSPSVTDEPSDVAVDEQGYTTGHVNINDIPDMDKTTMFGFATAMVSGDREEKAKEADLAKFRAREPGNPPGSDGETVQSQAEPADQPAA